MGELNQIASHIRVAQQDFLTLLNYHSRLALSHAHAHEITSDNEKRYLVST